MKKKLLLFIFLAVLINICWQCSRDRIYYYKIPCVNKMLTIYIFQHIVIQLMLI